MIKYNLNTINDWNFGDDNIIKVYRNNAVCYYKVTSGDTPTPVQEPCFAVVDDISQYQDTEFEDVFNNADGLWYKLNNLNQYEEYGIYGSGRTITTYEGKLTIDDGYEYLYSGGSWVNVGEVSGSSKTSDFTIGDINDNVTIKSSIADGDYYVISYYNHNNPKEPRYMMSYTESNNYLNNFSGHTGSNSITPSTIIDAAIWKFEATSSANTYYIKNIHNNLYWGYQTRVSNRSLNLVGESDSSKAIVKVGVANSSTTVGFLELNVNGSSYTYEDGTVGGYALNQLNGYTYRMNWWNTRGWGSDGNSAYYLYKIEGGTIVYPVEYDEIQDPPNNLTFSSMTEAESYECPWVGMKATIDGDNYIFSGDSQSGYEWVYQALPYIELQYIEMPQTSPYCAVQLADSYSASTNLYYDFTIMLHAISDTRIIGFNTNSYLIGYNGSSMYLNISDSRKFTINNFATDTVYHFGLGYKNGSNVFENIDTSTTYSSYNGALPKTDKPLFGAIKINGTVNVNGDSERIYAIKVYDGSTLVGDYIPVKRISDDFVTLYDKVSAQFCDTVGDGTMVAGNPI